MWSLCAGAPTQAFSFAITSRLQPTTPTYKIINLTGNAINQTSLSWGDVKATAYYSSSSVGNNAFVAAKLNAYPTGVGITAPVESTAAPLHAIDNYMGNEFLLLDFGDKFLASKLMIGYEGSTHSGYLESSPDVQAAGVT